jgi:hypothetical protein
VIECPHCHDENSDDVEVCASCGGDLRVSDDHEPEDVAAPDDSHEEDTLLAESGSVSRDSSIVAEGSTTEADALPAAPPLEPSEEVASASPPDENEAEEGSSAGKEPEVTTEAQPEILVDKVSDSAPPAAQAVKKEDAPARTVDVEVPDSDEEVAASAVDDEEVAAEVAADESSPEEDTVQAEVPVEAGAVSESVETEPASDTPAEGIEEVGSGDAVTESSVATDEVSEAEAEEVFVQSEEAEAEAEAVITAPDQPVDMVVSQDVAPAIDVSEAETERGVEDSQPPDTESEITAAEETSAADEKPLPDPLDRLAVFDDDSPEDTLVFSEETKRELAQLAQSQTKTRQMDTDGRDENEPRWGDAHFDIQTRLAVHIVKISKTIELDIHRTGTVVLGRLGETADLPPRADFTVYGATEDGVSREHARFDVKDYSLYITDLNSTNFTFLNGLRIMPNQPRIVRDGDEIRLGRLKLQLFFIREAGRES